MDIPAWKRCGRYDTEVDDGQSSSGGKKGKKATLELQDSQSINRFVYKVIVRVIDDTRSTSMLLFDDMAFKLRKKLLLRFHYTDEHITNNNHVYQVKMMSEDEAMITLFKKDFIIKDDVDDMQTPLLSNAKSSKFNTVDTIPFNIDETPKYAKVHLKEMKLMEMVKAALRQLKVTEEILGVENVQSSTLMITTKGRQKQKE
ncbi:hypothetical protein Tco_0921035 [Tanacetum coccineum]